MNKSILALCIFFFSLHAEMVQLPIGNFALPTSQQPSPLFCFGQNIVDKGDIQFLADINIGQIFNKTFVIPFPGMFWGLSDNFCLYWAAPFVFEHSKGFTTHATVDGFFLQGEYACYSHKEPTYTNQITAVFNFFASSGNLNERLPLNIESTGLFAGFTACHMEQIWYYFISSGINWSFDSNETHEFDVDILYQGGIARNIGYKSEKFVTTIMLEFLGTYDRNLKENSLFLGPTFWFATQRLAINTGFAFAVNRFAPEIKRRKTWIAAFDFRWKF